MITILLVDDDEAVRELLRLYAEGRGLRVIGEAVNGEHAVVLAERFMPDAIVLDQKMPRMTGLEAMPLLRARCPASKIVIYSSGPRPISEEAARASGASDYIEKSESPRTVIEHVVALTAAA